jgi:hypothetical protein
MADRPTSGSQLPNSIARAWYGPGDSIPAIAPASTLPRRYDYPWNLNINYGQRKYERVSFDTMRELARENYLIRVILEKVKARLTTVKWEFRLRAQSGEHLASAREKSAKDARVKALYKKFERPDGEHDWPEWLNALLEDRFVIDAPTIWVARDRKDAIDRLITVDGASINRIVDDIGMTPAPPYAAYQQLIKGMPAINFTTEDLIYMPHNFRSYKLFGYSEVEQTIRLGQTQINRAIWTLNHYTEGNVPEAFFLFKGENWSADQIEQLMSTLNSQLNGDLATRQRMYPLPDGNVVQMRAQELFDGFDEFMARIFCYTMGEPPTALVKAVNRASSEQMDDTREESGEKPAVGWINQLLNRIIQNPLYFGWDDIEAAPLPDTEIDGLKQAQIWQITVPLNIDTVDEARIQQGKPPLTEEQKTEIQAALPQAAGSGDGEDGKEPKPKKAKAEKAASVKKKMSQRSQQASEPSLAVLPMPGRSYLY